MILRPTKKGPCARCEHSHAQHGPSGCADCPPGTKKDCLAYVDPECDTCDGKGYYHTGAFVTVNEMLHPILSNCPDCDSR